MIPIKVIAGDSFAYSVSVGDYTGYGSTLYLRGPGSITLTGSEVGDKFEFSATAAETAIWPAGAYSYVVVASQGAEQYSIDGGSTEVVVRIDLTNKTDYRTHAQKTLDAIEAVIECRATKDQESYTIGNRSLSKMPIEDLLKFRGHYRDEVAREQGTYRGKVNVRMYV